MKKISLFVFLALLASCSTPKVRSEIVDEKIVKQVVKGSPTEAELALQTEGDIKTFDFQKIFKRANKYYDAAIKWERVKCVPQSVFVCTKRECPRLDVKKDSFMILDKKQKSVALCRDKFCNYFSAEFEQTGVFVNVQIKELVGIYIKVLGDSRYKEISMVGLDSYITNGNCAPVAVDNANKSK